VVANEALQMHGIYPGAWYCKPEYAVQMCVQVQNYLKYEQS